MTKLERNKSIFECHEQGLKQKVIGKIFSITQGAVSQVIKAMKDGVPEPQKEERGAKSKLTTAQKEELKSMLSNSPTDYDYFTWDKWSVKALIKNEFSVDYHENYIWKIMRCINFSSQRPQLKDYRKRQEDVDKFKAEKAAALKKSRR